VAFVHDHLVQRGGSERVLVSMLRAFPGAPVYTAFYRPASTYPELSDADIRCFALDRVPALRRNHRAAFAVLPLLFSRQHIEADVVVCSSSGWAQAVHTDGRKIVYFHALAQWLHTPLSHVARESVARRAVFGAARRALTRWDRDTVLSADSYAVAGRSMRERVHDLYGVDAAVLPPPAGLGPDGPSVVSPGAVPGFFLSAARLMPYKNIDAIVAAFAHLPDERLVVAGDGREGRRLRRAAPPNVLFVGEADDSQLRWLYANCRAVICAGFESYGLAPIEASAFGKPTVALRVGGLVDVVREGQTGQFFDRPAALAIADAVRRATPARYSPDALQRLGDLHSERAFVDGLRSLVEEELGHTGKRLAS
jgi:glycosyltransferase involved in cell wall biosynthesis